MVFSNLEINNNNSYSNANNNTSNNNNNNTATNANNNNEMESSPRLRAISYTSNGANTPRTIATARTNATPRSSRRSASSLLQRSKSARGSFLKSKIDKLVPINANDFLSILHKTQTFFTIELVDPQINFIDVASHSSILIVAGQANIEGKRWYSVDIFD